VRLKPKEWQIPMLGQNRKEGKERQDMELAQGTVALIDV
jgi:hypothetical protein